MGESPLGVRLISAAGSDEHGHVGGEGLILQRGDGDAIAQFGHLGDDGERERERERERAREREKASILRLVSAKSIRI